MKKIKRGDFVVGNAKSIGKYCTSKKGNGFGIVLDTDENENIFSALWFDKNNKFYAELSMLDMSCFDLKEENTNKEVPLSIEEEMMKYPERFQTYIKKDEWIDLRLELRTTISIKVCKWNCFGIKDCTWVIEKLFDGYTYNEIVRRK